MTLLQLAPIEALREGAEMWCVAPSAVSRWTQKLDWYCNFLIAKAERHQPPVLHSFLEEKSVEWSVSIPEIWVHEKAPTLVGTERRLPTRSILVLDCQDPLKWCEDAIRIGLKSQTKRMRLFSSDHVQESKWLEALSSAVHRFDGGGNRKADAQPTSDLQVEWVASLV